MTLSKLLTLLILLAAGGILAQLAQAPQAIPKTLADSPLAAGISPTPQQDIPYTVLILPAGPVVAGEVIRYQYQLTNDTPRRVEDITIYLPLNGWELVGYRISGPATAKDKGENFAAPLLLAGERIIITIYAKPVMPAGNPWVCLHAATTYGNPAGVGSSTGCIEVIKGK